MTSYELSRAWFDFCFENPEKINPGHTAVFFFAIEHCNRLGWKDKFGFPSQMAMDAIGIRKYQTYVKFLNDLVEWGFFKMIQKSKNQYSANIICLQNAMPKNGKALDKAIKKHGQKQLQSTGQSTGQSMDSIDKPINQELYNQAKRIQKVICHITPILNLPGLLEPFVNNQECLSRAYPKLLWRGGSFYIPGLFQPLVILSQGTTSGITGKV